MDTNDAHQRPANNFLPSGLQSTKNQDACQANNLKSDFQTQINQNLENKQMPASIMTNQMNFKEQKEILEVLNQMIFFVGLALETDHPSISSEKTESEESMSSNEQIQQIQSNVPKPRFTCMHAQCGKSFSRLARLNSHMRVHQGTQLRCSFSGCGKMFSERPNLTIHMRSHTKEKPFPCRICGRAFSTKGNMTDHERRHNKEKPYFCKFCRKSFYRKNWMQQHESKCHASYKKTSSKARKGLVMSRENSDSMIKAELNDQSRSHQQLQSHNPQIQMHSSILVPEAKKSETMSIQGQSSAVQKDRSVLFQGEKKVNDQSGQPKQGQFIIKETSEIEQEIPGDKVFELNRPNIKMKRLVSSSTFQGGSLQQLRSNEHQIGMKPYTSTFKSTQNKLSDLILNEKCFSENNKLNQHSCQPQFAAENLNMQKVQAASHISKEVFNNYGTNYDPTLTPNNEIRSCPQDMNKSPLSSSYQIPNNYPYIPLPYQNVTNKIEVEIISPNLNSQSEDISNQFQAQQIEQRQPTTIQYQRGLINQQTIQNQRANQFYIINHDQQQHLQKHHQPVLLVPPIQNQALLLNCGLFSSYSSTFPLQMNGALSYTNPQILHTGIINLPQTFAQPLVLPHAHSGLHSQSIQNGGNHHFQSMEIGNPHGTQFNNTQFNNGVVPPPFLYNPQSFQQSLQNNMNQQQAPVYQTPHYLLTSSMTQIPSAPDYYFI